VGVPATALLLWARDGGLATISSSVGGALTGVGQLSGLAAGLAALAGLALAARPAVIERRYGLDRMLSWHRWTGMVAAFGLLVHVVTLVTAYSLRASTNPFSEVVFLFGEPWMPSAMAGGALMALVALTSWRRIKRRMAYETWYYLHVLGYLSVALALGHVLVLGSDFAGNLVAQVWWVALYLAVAWTILVSRVWPLAKSLARPLRVTGVQTLPDGSLSIWVAGPALAAMHANPGQFFSLRFGVRGLWWQTHPYSLSAAPFAGGLRFTFTPGDDAAAFQRIAVGTRVWLEGPYGTFTADRAHGSAVVLIGAGSGIAPLRAILEDLSPASAPIVLLRVRQAEHAWFVTELQQLTERLGGRLHLITGSRASLAPHDPFSPAALAAAVDDLPTRAAFICGPTGMTRAATRGLRGAGMPASAIHTERYVY
jgi:predicted ferric reductase